MACNKEVIDRKEKSLPEENTESIKYLALGDFYTIGEIVAQSDRYPVQLASRLRNDGIAIEEPKIIARTGWYTDDLISALETSNLTDTFDIVSLLIRVNNQCQGSLISRNETEFTQLLNQAIAYAGREKSKVFVLSIPDYGFTPFGASGQERISSEIDVYNAINRRITETAGINWFDVTPISRNGINFPELVASDGLHPSGEMYRQRVQLFYGEVKSKLD